MKMTNDVIEYIMDNKNFVGVKTAVYQSLAYACGFLIAKTEKAEDQEQSLAALVSHIDKVMTFYQKEKK